MDACGILLCCAVLCYLQPLSFGFAMCINRVHDPDEAVRDHRAARYPFVPLQLLDIKDWTDALKGGLPPVKLPKYVFGTAGCYSFMEEKLRPILEYEDLKTGVFQVGAGVATCCFWRGQLRVWRCNCGVEEWGDVIL